MIYVYVAIPFVVVTVAVGIIAYVLDRKLPESN